MFKIIQNDYPFKLELLIWPIQLDIKFIINTFNFQIFKLFYIRLPPKLFTLIFFNKPKI